MRYQPWLRKSGSLCRYHLARANRLYAGTTLSPYADTAANIKSRYLWLDERMIGFSCCMRTETPGELKIDKLYIHCDHQRKGYGAMLIANAIEIMRENNLQSLILTVNKKNQAAISAYHHYGFEITDDSIVDIGGGFIMNDYRMTMTKFSRWNS